MMTKLLKDRKVKDRIVFLALLLIVSALFISLSAEPVSANAVTDAFRNLGTSDTPGMLDFLIFSVIFISICWIGFHSVFKEAKAAAIALSVALGLGLSAGLVFGGNIGVKKLLPGAIILLFIAGFICLFALLKKFVFTKDSKGSKFLAFFVAIIIAVAIIAGAVALICKGDRCESNAFLNRFIGSGSVLGGLWSDVTDIAETPATTADDAPNSVAGDKCGDGVVVLPEKCDPKAPNQGCGPKEECSYCMTCQPQGTAADAADAAKGAGGLFSDNWGKIALIAGGIVLLFILIFKGKPIYNRIKDRRQRKKRQKMLDQASVSQKEMTDKIKDLTADVQEEKKSLVETKVIVDSIMDDIAKNTDKACTPYNISLAQKIKEEKHIEDKLSALHKLCDHEISIIKDTVIPNIKSAIVSLEKEMREHPELFEGMDAIVMSKDKLEEHKRSLDVLKNAEAWKDGVIGQIVSDFKAQEDQFSNFQKSCDEMIKIIEYLREGVEKGANGDNFTGSAAYSESMDVLKGLHLNALRATSIFSNKVNLLRQIIAKFEDLKKDVVKMHEAEVKYLEELIRQASGANDGGLYDTAIYLASLVAENCDLLKHKELDEKTAQTLEKLKADAIALIEKSIDDVKKRSNTIFEQDLCNGVKNADERDKIDKALAFYSRMANINFVSTKRERDFHIKTAEYANKMRNSVKIVINISDSMKLFDQICTDVRSDTMSAKYEDFFNKMKAAIDIMDISKAFPEHLKEVLEVMILNVNLLKAYQTLVEVSAAPAQGNDAKAKALDSFRMLAKRTENKFRLPPSVIKKLQDYIETVADDFAIEH